MAPEECRTATTEEIAAARAQLTEDDIQIDDDALVSEIDGSDNVWVQAWVYVRKE